MGEREVHDGLVGQVTVAARRACNLLAVLYRPFSLLPASAVAGKAFPSLLTTRERSYCTTNDTNRTLRLMSDARRHGRRAFKALMRSYHLKIPKYNLPLRFRPVSRPPAPGVYT